MRHLRIPCNIRLASVAVSMMKIRRIQKSLIMIILIIATLRKRYLASSIALASHTVVRVRLSSLSRSLPLITPRRQILMRHRAHITEITRRKITSTLRVLTRRPRITMTIRRTMSQINISIVYSRLCHITVRRRYITAL